MRELGVWMDNDLVGTLRMDENRRFSFQYHEGWLRAGQVPLSLSLPPRIEPFPDEVARPFFVNLLPESGLREAVARKLGISVGNDFALLEALGGECAGALTLLPPGAPPQAGGEYQELSEEELQRIIEELPRRPLLAGEQGVRLSLAGAQGKLPVAMPNDLEDDRVFLPRGTLASSHILKTEIPDLKGSVRNEAFCMALAGRMGLPVPPSRVRAGRQPVYVVERFDRRRGQDGAIVRLHQEDFCQALGRAAETKYESEGGPSLADCFGLLEERSTSPALDRKALLRWVVFNALVHNADAHAKNISLLLTPGSVRLAPFYDLLCTGVYPQLADKLAMKVGGENRPGWIQERHWERFALDAGLGRKLVLDTVAEMAGRVLSAAREVAGKQEATWGPAPVVGKIVELVGRLSRRFQGVAT